MSTSFFSKALAIVLSLAGPSLCADEAPFITWVNPPTPPQPLLQHKTYESAVMKTAVGYQIYLPSGYKESSATTRYTVIYWLHGRGGSESRDQFPPAIVDEAIRTKAIPPVIVVYVNGGRWSWYTDSPDGKWLAETTIIRELIPHIDATYRTVADRRGRAIQGMSMGGHGALKFAFKYPELFSSVVSFAGSLRPVDQIEGDKERGMIFTTMFGGSAERYTAEHPTALLRQNADKVRGRVGIKLYIGTKDRENLVANNRSLHALLEELKIPHDYTEPEGIGHDLRKLSEFAKADGLIFAVKHFSIGQFK
ncbi:MAG: hypothetical protein EOP84_09335 [Verrucomicrobiaceae bacterium]|nr:MAG: hypothetical protein EOP84_09335 [Verrucomicrobiaceae bacterium]